MLFAHAFKLDTEPLKKRHTGISKRIKGLKFGFKILYIGSKNNVIKISKPMEINKVKY